MILYGFGWIYLQTLAGARIRIAKQESFTQALTVVNRGTPVMTVAAGKLF